MSQTSNLRRRIPFTSQRLTILMASLVVLLLASVFLLSGCKTVSRPGTMTSRKGDEIVVAGHFVHTGTRVVLWMDPGGYDAYRVERRFSPIQRSDWAHSTEEVPELSLEPQSRPQVTEQKAAA